MAKRVILLGLVVAMSLALPLILSGQTREPKQVFGRVISGEDLQFVVEGLEGNVAHGRLMVRIEDRWYHASPKVSPRFALELLEDR
jgi:hypothetical protein